MNKFDWHPRHHQAALDGMLMLTLEERGAYNTLLDLIYSRAAPVPDEDRWLAGWMGCTVRKWKTLRASLIAKGKIFALNVDGVDCLMNRRAAEEIAIAETRANSNAENGGKGGRKSAEKSRKNAGADIKPNEIKDGREAPLQASVDLKTRTETKTESAAAECAGASSETWPDGGLPAWRDALCLLAGPGLADPAKSPGLVTTVAEIDRWRLMGCSWGQDVIPTIQGRTLKPRPANPIGSWTLFTQDVLAAKARREAAVEAPNVVQLQATGPPVNAAAAMREEGRKRALARYSDDETATSH